MSTAQIEPLGNSALLIRFGNRIATAMNARALAVTAALLQANLPGVHDVAPAYASVCVQYDPMIWADPTHVQLPFARIALRISGLVDNAALAHTPAMRTTIEIPVCYGGDFGPDLDGLAQHARLAVREVAARHCASDYRVAMLGFAPGFPYLLGLDPTLHAPRRTTPRTHVAAGSVAIGGAQTGIYPRESPGGWLLIGRTPLTLFDPARESPALLAPGQRVRFRAIAAGEFAVLAR
jgi:KipI family sensor histidine kinase inhibitor